MTSMNFPALRGPPGVEPGSEPASTVPSGARAQLREVKDQVVDQAKSSIRQARDRATSSLAESRQQAADRIGGVASAFRRTSDHLRTENQDRVASLTDSLARQVDQLSSYLRDTDARALRQDLEDLARRRPAVVLGAAFALGLLGARFFKSSERDLGGAGGGGFDAGA